MTAYDNYDPKQTRKTLTSFFYDLVKAIPAGVINNALINTILVDDAGKPIEIDYCDEHLRSYAESVADQLLNYRTKYSRSQLRSMRPNEHYDTVAKED